MLTSHARSEGIQPMELPSADGLELVPLLPTIISYGTSSEPEKSRKLHHRGHEEEGFRYALVWNGIRLRMLVM